MQGFRISITLTLTLHCPVHGVTWALRCVQPGDVDECGVCGGLGTTCALALTLTVDMLTATGSAMPDAGARVSCRPQSQKNNCTQSPRMLPQTYGIWLGMSEIPCAGAKMVPHTS